MRSCEGDLGRKTDSTRYFATLFKKNQQTILVSFSLYEKTYS